MTTDTQSLPASSRARLPGFSWRRFALTFVITLLALLVLASLAAFAYARMNDGRILPGVSISGVDVAGLPTLLEADAAYIGVIGSKRRWLTTAKALKETGVSEQLIAKVHSPMGLELNAETPEEIAVSIMAEILMIKDKGTGKAMKTSGQ